MYSLPEVSQELIQTPVMLLVSQKRMAEYCGVSERTISRWVKYHQFPEGILPDGSACVSTSDISQWARERMHQPKKTMAPAEVTEAVA